MKTLPGQLHQIQSIDDIPSNCTYSQEVIAAAQNRKQTDTGGLAKILWLKVGARIMLTVNIDIEDRLINGQVGEVSYIEMSCNKVKKVYVKFDDCRAGRKRMSLNVLARQNNWVPVEKCETEIKIIKRSQASPCIRRTQFPLALSWASTVHKVQGLSIEKAVINFDLLKQRAFNQGQMYTALSRVTTYNGLFLTGEFKKSAIKANVGAEKEYERLRKDNIFDSIEKYLVSNDSLTLVLLNSRSLAKHVLDISKDQRLLNNDFICFTETQVKPTHSVSQISENLKNFTMYFNNNEDQF